MGSFSELLVIIAGGAFSLASFCILIIVTQPVEVWIALMVLIIMMAIWLWGKLPRTWGELPILSSMARSMLKNIV